MQSLGETTRNWLEAGLGFLYPPVCQFCKTNRATAKEGYVCRDCWTLVRFIRAPFCDRCGLPFEGDLTTIFECTNCRQMELHFTSARSAVVAKTLVLEAIHRYKYSHSLWFEEFLADLLIREAAPALRGQGWDYLVPVPLHPLKRREREFNQAELLARRLGAATGIPVHTKLVQRTTATLTQTRLSREERATNMKDAFVVGQAVRLAGQKIVILDDVFTTGATTNACAKALRAAGAGDVCVWTVARGI